MGQTTGQITISFEGDSAPIIKFTGFVTARQSNTLHRFMRVEYRKHAYAVGKQAEVAQKEEQRVAAAKEEQAKVIEEKKAEQAAKLEATKKPQEKNDETRGSTETTKVTGSTGSTEGDQVGGQAQVPPK